MKSLLAVIFLFVASSTSAQKVSSSNFQFEYEMFLQVDFKKREAYLQKIGKKPDAYEIAISFIK